MMGRKTGDAMFYGAGVILVAMSVAEFLALRSAYIPGHFPLYTVPVEITGMLISMGLLIMAVLRWRQISARGGLLDPVNGALNKLPDLLNDLPVPAAFITSDFRYGFANTAYSRIFGVKPDTLVGRKIVEVMPKENWPSIEPMLKRAFEGQAVSWDASLLKPSGQSLNGKVTYVPVRTNGSVTGVLVLFVDRSEIDEAQNTVYMQAARQALAAEVAGVGYLEWDADLNMLDASQDAASLFDRTPEQLQADWRDIRIGKLNSKPGTFMAVLAAELKRERHTDPTYRIVSADGPRDDLFMRMSLRRVESAGAVRIVAAVQNVTEQQQNIDELFNSEQRFRDFTKSATDWLWEEDENRRITFVSAGHDAELDRQMQGFIGKTVNELDLAAKEAEFDLIAEAMEKRIPFRSKKLVINFPNRQNVYADVSGRPVYNRSGAFKGYRGTTFDLTAIRQAEEDTRSTREAFATAFENISSIVVLFDGEDRLVHCNTQFLKFSGMTLKHVVGMSFTDLITDLVERTVANGEHEKARWFTERLDRRNNPARNARVEVGGGRWMEVSDYPVANDGILSIATDVTERVRESEALRAHQAALQVFDRRETLGQMAAAIAHEMNQPLAAISNFASGCVLRAQNGQLKETDLVPVMTNMAAQSERASKILRSMSDYLWSGKSEQKQVPVSDILTTVSLLLKPESGAIGIPLVITDRTGDREIICAKIEIEQLIINLVRNAFEATAATRADGSVTLDAAIDAQNLVLEVIDQGSGFADGADNSTFEPFKSTKEKGLGVGLAICRTIVNSHEGDIEIAQSGPEGTRMRVTIPLGTRAEDG